LLIGETQRPTPHNASRSRVWHPLLTIHILRGTPVEARLHRGLHRERVQHPPHCVSASRFLPAFAPCHSTSSTRFPHAATLCGLFLPGEERHDVDARIRRTASRRHTVPLLASCLPSQAFAPDSVISLHSYYSTIQYIVQARRESPRCHQPPSLTFRRKRRQKLDARSLPSTDSRHANLASRRLHTVLPQLPASGHQARSSPASHNRSVDAGVGNWAGAGLCWPLAGNRAWGGVTLGIPVEILLCRSNHLTRFGRPTDTQKQPLASKAEEETPQLTWRKGEKQVARQLLETLPSTEIKTRSMRPI
jgi:hypothetical protein